MKDDKQPDRGEIDPVGSRINNKTVAYNKDNVNTFKKNKTLPFNNKEVVDYEQCLLGSYLIGASIGQGITESAFYTKRHQVIFSAIRELKAQGLEVNILILTNELQKHGKLDSAGGADYVTSLTDSAASGANVSFYEDEVLQASQCRSLYEAAARVQRALEGRETPDAARKIWDAANLNLSNKGNGKSGISYGRMTAAEILKADYPPVSWVCEGVIPGGLTIISGPPKGCKSWLALHTGTAVSSGGCFMGSVQVEQGPVLYLALEDNFRRIKSRLEKQQGIGNDNFFIETPSTWKGGIAALRQYITEFPDTKLIIIDTLFKFSPIVDTNSYSETYGPISAIQGIAAEVPILLIHHTRKSARNGTAEVWAEEGMGSQGIFSACDTIIVLKKPDGEAKGTLTIKGRDIEEKRLDVLFDRDICTWRIIGEGSVVRQEPRAQAEILALLKDAGPDGMKTGDIADALEKKPNAVLDILKNLLIKGKVKKLSRGIWSANSDIQESSELNTTELAEFGERANSVNSVLLRETEFLNLGEAPAPAAGELEIW